MLFRAVVKDFVRLAWIKIKSIMQIAHCAKPKASPDSCQITGVSTPAAKSQFPASISIGELSRAGRLVALPQVRTQPLFRAF